MTEAVMSALDNFIYGMADVIVERPDGTTISFDGKVTDDGTSFLQAEGAEFSFKPTFNDIKTADTGESNLDDRVSGFDVSLKLTVTQEDLKLLEFALAGVSAIKGTDNTKMIGLTDAPLGASNRKRAGKVTIHPRERGADKSRDITIYKAAPKSDFTRAYKNEQGTFDIELQAYPRDSFNMSAPGNYFFIGETDPNA